MSNLVSCIESLREEGYTTVVLHSLLSNLVAQRSNLVSCIESLREEGYTTVVLHM